ncbi:MAG: hypothetical protein IRZ08_04525, partial [Frankia sp.]|nr:hypothetical protein [Frankia sp.]
MREQHGQGVRRRGSAALAGVVSAGDEPVHRAGRAGLGTGRPGLAGTAGTGGPVLPSQPWPGWDGPELPDEWLAPASAAAPSAGPDGRLAFIDDRDGAPALWLLEPAAAEPGGRAPGLGTQRRVDTGPG